MEGNRAGILYCLNACHNYNSQLQVGVSSAVCLQQATRSTYGENDAAALSLERAVLNLLFELARPFLCYILPCVYTVYTVSVKQTEKLAPVKITA